MTLISIAHLGEAQSFIRQLKLKKIDNYCYQGENTILIITGEGPSEVFCLLPFYIAKYLPSRIINFGIAGALDKSIQIEKIYSIQTTYGHMEKSPRFQSFTSADNDATKDCITCEMRIFDNNFAKHLSSFAEIVDREVWAVGKVAKKFKIPFYAYKMISDYAGEETSCFDLKERAKYFSDSLVNHYLSNVLTLEAAKNNMEDDFNFHLSFTQKKSLHKLMNKLNLNTKNINNIFNELKEQNPKKREKELASVLIKKLQYSLNPVNEKIERKFHQLAKGFDEIGAKLLFNPQTDKKNLTLRMDINDQKNIDNLQKELAKLSFSEFEKLWDGDFDVS